MSGKNKRPARHGPHADKYAGAKRQPIPSQQNDLPRVAIVTSQADIRRRDALRQARAEEREAKRAARENTSEQGTSE